MGVSAAVPGADALCWGEAESAAEPEAWLLGWGELEAEGDALWLGLTDGDGEVVGGADAAAEPV